MNTFSRKGYGRIYVDDAANIDKVSKIIERIDDFEYSYLPANFIAPYTEYPKVVYTGKFDGLDLDKFTARCWREGVKVWCFDSGSEEYPKA